MRTCVMTYIWSSLWRRQVEIYHHCMSACLCVCICCKHVGVNVGISCVAVYQSLLGGFSQLTASSSAVHVYLQHTCSLGSCCVMRSSMFVSSISVYICACMCCTKCARSSISWRLPILKPFPVYQHHALAQARLCRQPKIKGVEVQW